MAHEFRIAKPTIGYDHRRGQCHTAPAKSRHAPIKHTLHPVQFVATRRPRACRVRTPDGKVDRHHHVPTRPNCSPYFLKTESSPTHVHCQRLRVASLLLAA